MCHRQGTGGKIGNSYVQVAANTENGLSDTSEKKKKKSKHGELIVHEVISESQLTS